jgi:hypothetical protein
MGTKDVIMAEKPEGTHLATTDTKPLAMVMMSKPIKPVWQ